MRGDVTYAGPTDRPGRRRGVVAVCRRAGMDPAGLVGAVGSGAMSALCGIGLMATSGWLITRASTRPHVYVLGVAIGAVQAFALGRGLFRYLQRLSVHGVALAALSKLRLRLYDDIEPLVPGGLPAGGSGGVLSAFVSDSELVANGLAQGITGAVDVAASVLLGTVVAVLFAPGPAAVLATGSLAVIAVAFAGARAGRSATEDEAVLRAELAGSVMDTLRSARELVAYGREDLVAERLRSSGRRSTSAALRQAVAGGLGRAGCTWAAGAALIGVAASGLAAEHSKHISGVLLAVIVFAAMATLDQVVALPAVLADVSAARSGADRMRLLAELPAPVREPSQDGGQFPGDGSAALEEAVVASREGRLILDGATLGVSPGERVALVGRSGAGKTTAVHSLLHFVDCAAGRATIGGNDVRRLTRGHLGQEVGWMSEDTHVFAATLADNLRLARTAATEAECEDALCRVGLGDWSAALPDGLATMLGAGGRPTSAGERQRLGLARAVLAGGSVLLLDEPTAHLDPSSSPRVLADLLAAAGERAVLVVSHEPDIAVHVDRVLTLRSGRVDDPTSEPLETP